MDLFEFVVSLYVVLAGLGITLLVRSIGQVIESRSQIELYWVHSCWVAFVLLAHINSWFMMWRYRDITSWTVGEFLLLLSVPTVLYLASHVSVPEITPDTHPQHYDMRDYYYERHRLIIGLIGLSVVLNVICEYLLIGHIGRSATNLLRLAGLAVLVVGIASSRPRVQAAVTLSIAAIVLLGLGAVNDSIE